MILLAFGTVPEYIKLKPLIYMFDSNNVPHKTLFTGQHSDLLKNNKTDYRINIIDGENRLDCIIKSIMDTSIFDDKEISYVVVQGDTTSALAVALSAFHHDVKVIHLEAGLRTYDKSNPFPEEINRRIISQLATIHLCPTNLSANNLYNEHVDIKDVFVVGNTVIDNLLPYKDKCEYTNKILVTLHRRENHHWMDKWFIEIDKLAVQYPEYEFIVPIHPNPNVIKHKELLKHTTIIDRLPYDEMLDLLVKTKLVITDSGGLQEECSFLNKKCLTCRKITERPEAVGQSSFIVKSPTALKEMFDKHVNNYEISYDCPFGDGHSAEKIFEILKKLN
jgi:UDP-N-acetylglucosamine 2-epimerase (non-hydrolysing)